MGRHSKGQPPLRPRRTVEMVDARTLTAHLLTDDAHVAGMPRGRYTTICAEYIECAALVAKEARWCPLCIPRQRGRGGR